MSTSPAIKCFDAVELTETIDSAPAGSTGVVVEMLDTETAMVEVMTMPLEPTLDRIVVAPLTKLRRKESPRQAAA